MRKNPGQMTGVGLTALVAKQRLNKVQAYALHGRKLMRTKCKLMRYGTDVSRGA